MHESETTLTIARTAMRLRCRYQRARDLVLCGELDGWQDASGRWRVTAASIDAWLARRVDGEPSEA